ncbi:ATP-binding cassette domain-containing protein, partial [Escherichia coli]|uniref:ATP-binding cassette domain-containing protein n=1 Tax=Escherichia coli TaxID=562 RepID=UPI00128FA09C
MTPSRIHRLSLTHFRNYRTATLQVAGDMVVLVGPNGAGKTTLFNMISGVLRPSGGRISFDGIDLATISP